MISGKTTLNCSFQFPSNGKVYPKRQTGINQPPHLMLSFNSLQTGKCIQRQEHHAFRRMLQKFQFPSNGKVYPKNRSCHTSVVILYLFQFPSNGKVYPKVSETGLVDEQENRCFVSIPFKRESVSKVTERKPSKAYPPSFNSLQTGKCIQRPKYNALGTTRQRGFNSLQTGKCIQRKGC